MRLPAGQVIRKKSVAYPLADLLGRVDGIFHVALLLVRTLALLFSLVEAGHNNLLIALEVAPVRMRLELVGWLT